MARSIFNLTLAVFLTVYLFLVVLVECQPLIQNIITPSSYLHDKFKVIKINHNKQFDFLAVELKHRKSKAEILLLLSQTEKGKEEHSERTFAISFRTPVDNSKGTPHIVEHSVLSGSKSFPLSFVISEIEKTSQATFINALTYPSHTVYPITTHLAKDFLNLANVYLDAVFQPLVLSDESIFLREGWHYEMASVDSPLKCSGVVMNEMKGVYSDPKSVLIDALTRNLLPNTTYRFSSGGIPNDIRELTYSELLEYYYQHYHPANSKTLFFGPPGPEIEDFLFMMDGYLFNASRRYQEDLGREYFDPKVTLPLAQEYLSGPFLAIEETPPSESEPLDTVVLAFNLAETDIPLSERLKLEILGHVLSGKRISPLYKTLESSQIGRNVINYGTFDYSQNYIFAIGVSGIDQSIDHSEDLVQNLLIDKLQNLYDNGLPVEAIEASVMMTEFKLREDISNSVQRGIKFMEIVFNEWNYDRDPLTGFNTLDALKKLKRELKEEKDDNVMRNAMKKYLIDNEHRLLLKMASVPNFNSKVIAQEVESLKNTLSKMSKNEKEETVRITKWLKAKQTQPDPPDAIKTVPRLQLSDISKEGVEYPFIISQSEGGSIILSHPFKTAGIVYSNIYYPINHLMLEEIDVLHLLNHLLSEPRTANRTATEFSYLTERVFGQLEFSTTLLKHQGPKGTVGDPSKVAAFWTVSFKCLEEKISLCSSLLLEIIFESLIDKSRQQETIKWLIEMKSKRESQIATSPTFASKRLAGRLSLAGRIDEHISGFESINNFKNLIIMATEDWDSLQNLLLKTRDKIFNYESSNIISISCSADCLKKVPRILTSSFLPSGQSTSASLNSTQFFDMIPLWREELPDCQFETKSTDGVREGWEARSFVSYVYVGAKLYSPGESAPFSHIIPASLYSDDKFFPHIRMAGGAYGASLTLNALAGDVIFSTYRDPHVQRSLNVVRNASAEMLSMADSLTQEEISRTVIKTLGRFDKPLTTPARLLTVFKRWITDETAEDRNEMRNQIYATSKKDLREFSDRLKKISEEENKNSEIHIHVVVSGPADKLNATFGSRELERHDPLLSAIQVST